MIHYLVCGIVIASDLMLPAFCVFEPGADVRPDVDVARVDDLPVMADVRETGPNWMLSPNQYRLRVPGIVDMLVSDGRKIEYVMLGDSGDDAAAFIASTGLGALLHQREDVVMHASAVQVGDGAALFCGPSGAGKSTIAAALVERGYPLVNDDFCALREQAGRIMLFPDGRQHKLWQEAVDSLSVGERVGKPVRPALKKFYVAPRLVTGNESPLPVAAIYALKEDRRVKAATISALNLVDAARAVRRNAYRPMLTRLMGQQQLYFQMTAKLLSQSVVADLTRRLDFTELPAVIDALEAEWSARGLNRAA